MDMIHEVLRRYIDGEEGKVAFRCCSRSEARKFLNMVSEVLQPSYYYFLSRDHEIFGTSGFECEVCYRIERKSGKLDWGHDKSGYYKRCGRIIIDVADLLNQKDYGEFTIDISDLSLLFDIKA